MILIGIIILNYNTQNETIECIESIINTTTCEYKIYVVDNNSNDNSYENLCNLYCNSELITVIAANNNGGYSVGNNIGIKRALDDNAEIVLLSNSDIIYFESSIDEIYNYSQNNSKIGIIGPKIVLENGEVQNSPRQNYNFTNYLLSKKPFKLFDINKINGRVYFKDYKYDKELVFQGLVSGCCIGLSKQYLELCGMLDEGTFLYFEESIIAHKARQKGLLTCVLPNSVVMHKCSISIGNQNSAFSRFHRYYSSMYMLKKYEGINNCQLSLLFILNIFPFIFHIKEIEYKKYLRLYIKDVLNLFNKHTFDRKLFSHEEG